MASRKYQLKYVNQTSKVSQKSLKRRNTSYTNQQVRNNGIQPNKRPKESKILNHLSENTSEIFMKSLKRVNTSDIDEHNAGIQPYKRSKKSQIPNRENESSSELQLADQRLFDEVCPVSSPVFGKLPKFGTMEKLLFLMEK